MYDNQSLSPFQIAGHCTDVLGPQGHLTLVKGRFFVRGRVASGAGYTRGMVPLPTPSPSMETKGPQEVLFAYSFPKNHNNTAYPHPFLRGGDTEALTQNEIIGNKIAVDRIFELVGLQGSGGDTPGPTVVLLYGQSGCGKMTSLMSACAHFYKQLVHVDATDTNLTQFRDTLSESLFPMKQSVVVLTGIGGLETSVSVEVCKTIVDTIGNFGRRTNLLFISDSCKGPIYLGMSKRQHQLSSIESIYFNSIDAKVARNNVKWKDQLNSYFPPASEWSGDFRQLRMLRTIFVGENEAAMFSERDSFLSCFAIAACLMGGIKGQSSSDLPSPEVMVGRITTADPAAVAGVVLENYEVVLKDHQKCAVSLTAHLSSLDLLLSSSSYSEADITHEMAATLLHSSLACFEWHQFRTGCRRGDFFSYHSSLNESKGAHRERISSYSAIEMLNKTFD